MPNKDLKLAGNIALIGFEILEPIELESIKKIVVPYIKKISENCQFDEMKLTLQQHPRGKSFKHEIKGAVFIDRDTRVVASVTKWNLYNAIADVCEKMYAEIIHKRKKEQRHDKKTFK